LSARRPALSVSILAAELLHLDRELARIEAAGVPLVHVDIMDGHVTPTISVGPRFVAALETPLLVDVHVLVSRPDSVVAELEMVGADIVTIQLETTERPLDTLKRVCRVPARHAPDERAFRGVAIGPQTDADTITPLLHEVDLVVVLGVDLASLTPINTSDVVRKLERVRDLVAGKALVAIDGGVALANIEHLVRAHPDIVVAGSAVFSGVFEDQVAALQQRAYAGMRM
jgi:ribulose-phosphate 3-epimerase